MDRAPRYEREGWGFESLRKCQIVITDLVVCETCNTRLHKQKRFCFHMHFSMVGGRGGTRRFDSVLNFGSGEKGSSPLEVQLKTEFIAPSSNGRTPDFDSGNCGSNPRGASID